MAEGTIQTVRRYLSTDEKPVGMSEFKEFWAACNEQERAEFKEQSVQLLGE